MKNKTIKHNQMKKLLLLLPALMMAFSGFAQETEEPELGTDSWTIEIILQTPVDQTITMPLEFLGNKTAAGYDIYTVDIDVESWPELRNQGNFKYFLNLNYTSESGNKVTTKLGTSTNGTAIQRSSNDQPVSITVSAWYNTKDNKVEYIDSYFNVLMIDTQADWTARGYWPSNSDNSDLAAYFVYDSEDNKGSGTIALRRAVNSGASNENYYCGSQNETRFTLPSMKGFKSGLYKATLDYRKLTLSIEPATSLDKYIQKYATLYAPTEVTLPSAVKAYSLNYVNGALLASEIKDIVPANTPVLLEVVDQEKENSVFNFVIENYDQCNYDAISSTKKYISDFVNSFSNNGQDDLYPAFIGISQTHYVPGDLDAYIINGATGQFELKSSKVNGTNLVANTSNVVTAFSAYIAFTSTLWGEDVDLSKIEIVFSEEDEPEDPAEDVIYVHFTDENGKYKSTSTIVLSYVNTDKSYQATVDFGVNQYFVLADAKFNENADTYRLLVEDVEDVASKNWADLGEEATIYHAPSSDTNINATTAAAIAKNATAEGDVIPFSAPSKAKYTLTLTLPEDDEAQAGVSAHYESTSGVDNVALDETLPVDNRIFNIYGQQVDETYKGIVIKNGKKMFLR